MATSVQTIINTSIKGYTGSTGGIGYSGSQGPIGYTGSTPTGKLDASGGTATNLTVTNYTETTASSSSSSYTVDLTTGTLHAVTTTGNITITLPSTTTGKSFTLVVVYGGAHTITWAGGARKWVDGNAPTPTSVNGKIDVFTFICVDGSNWLSFVSGQNL